MKFSLHHFSLLPFWKHKKVNHMPTNNFERLGHPTLKQYKEKLKVIENTDPYAIPDSDFSVDTANFPVVCTQNIVNYLVFSASPFLLMMWGFMKKLKLNMQVYEASVRDVKVLKKLVESCWGEDKLICNKFHELHHHVVSLLHKLYNSAIMMYRGFLLDNNILPWLPEVSKSNLICIFSKSYFLLWVP